MSGYCARCGLDSAPGPHAECERALDLEPPRYCVSCGRRMKVQVVPAGWRAECIEHGVSASEPS